ncbi:MAG: hypothetical protein M9962_12470 [Oligoflexia bacterium]|nr:hypothetical protein [Oligoflexia bacterium]
MTIVYRSDYDPKDSDEGGLDAVGLSSMGEYLAQLYLPGFLERHRRPRFLTLAVIGLSIKADVENIVGNKEYPTTFWEAYEWVIVTGLISSKDTTIKNLPSSDKAKAAMAQNKPLSADRYLVTPSVFGFHGVYKFLLKNLGLESHDLPGEFSQKLLHAWALDQKIPGFIDMSGDGTSERKELIKIIAETIQEGHVARSWNYRGWEFVYRNFHPLKLGSREKEVISSLLLNEPIRKEVFSFLNSKKGQKYLTDTSSTQRQFLTDLNKESSGNLKQTLDVILCYERFARSLNDIFYDALVELSENSIGLTSKEIAERIELKNKDFSAQLHRHYGDAYKAIHAHSDINISTRFDIFVKFEQVFTASDCIDAVLTHHLLIQQNKSTGAKNPWVFDVQGRWMVRASYAHRDQSAHDDSLVNLYRLGVLRLFYEDIGLINA